MNYMIINGRRELKIMVRHIVAWNYAEGFSDEENQINAKAIKRELENLKNLIEGIESIQVLINPIDTSDSDIMLDVVFVNEEALDNYRTHPEHVRVGTNFVKPAVCNRKCLDFLIL